MRLSVNEKQLLAKINGYVESVAQMQRDKNEAARSKADKEVEMARLQTESQKEIMLIHDKIMALEEVISHKDREINIFKSSQISREYLSVYETTIKALEEEKHGLLLDIHQYKAQLEEAAKECDNYKTQVEGYQRIQIENKHLSNKVNHLRKEIEELEHSKIKTDH